MLSAVTLALVCCNSRWRWSGMSADRAARTGPRGPQPGSGKRVHPSAVNWRYETNTEMEVNEMQ